MVPWILDVLDRPLSLELTVPHPGLRVLSTAELADCTCPEFCERDHDTD